MICKLIALTSCLLFAAVARAEEPMFHNPLVEQRADPFAYRHTDGFYYFTATMPEYDRIELRRAKSLDELGKSEAKTIWQKHATGPMGAHIWAPEIHFIDGKWFLYFAAGDATKVWDIRMYALSNASPNPLEGEWKEEGQITTDWESFSLDATTFAHKGQRYLSWAQHDPKLGGNTCLYIARMSSPTTIVGPQVRLSRPELPWETVGFKVNEGPAFLAHGDKVFISYSASATDANYCVGLLAADANADLLDPTSWTKSPGPVFQTDAANRIFGPGHNCFTTMPDGTDVFVYHARDYREIQGDPLHDPNRETRAQLLRWTADGRPDFGQPTTRPAN